MSGRPNGKAVCNGLRERAVGGLVAGGAAP